MNVIVFFVIEWVGVWLTWNWVVPDIFGLQAITIWQALGLSMLCSFMFKPSPDIEG